VSVVEVNGGDVAYEILGEAGAPLIVLTPGGRFTMDVPGLRPLADALVDGGMRVLLWNRPNSGGSDVQFYGVSESHMRAETLHGLLTAIGEGPCVIAGGSSGARDSILTAIMYPEIVSKLVVWSVSGGIYGTLVLGWNYVVQNIRAMMLGGLDAVLELPEWKVLIEADPKNRDRFLSLGGEEFQRVMMRWMLAWIPRPGQTIPGVEDWQVEEITAPTMIIRGGENDMVHPKRTSLELHTLIKGSRLVDPPWEEDAIERADSNKIRGAGSHFDPWVIAAPAILEFAK
jgi:2-hydroxy-6-oxonona-2,4-dienedioate hydrolase